MISENKLNTKFTDLEKQLISDMNSLKKDVQIEAFAYSYPGSIHTPSGYQPQNCIYLLTHNNSGSYGIQDLYLYCSMGHPERLASQVYDHHSLFVLSSKAWNFV